jgi:hypothetical protein
VLFVTQVPSRVVHVLGATTDPNGPWITQVARNFASALEDAGRRFRFLIRDRDTKFTASFDDVFASIEVETIRPDPFASCERVRRAVRPLHPPGMPRSSARLLTTTPRIGTRQVRPALQPGSSTSWPAPEAWVH